MKNKTFISLHCYAIAKRKRKSDFQSVRIAELDGHELLTPEQFNQFEREAWIKADELGLKNISKSEIVVNFGWINESANHLFGMELLPKQRQLIMRG